MKMQEIRRACEADFSQERNKEICRQLSHIDEGFIYPVDRNLLNCDPNQNPIQNIDSVLNENAGVLPKDLCNTWPFGVPTDEIYPRFLAICRGQTRLDTAFGEIKKQSKIMARECKEESKTVILLTDKWSLATFKRYEKNFLNHALQDGIWYIFLLVTEYGYTQIPFLPNGRYVLRKLSGEVVEDDFSMDDVYELLDSFEISYWGGTWQQHKRHMYKFDLTYMEWRKSSTLEGNDNGRIPEGALFNFINSVLWIKDRKESKIEPSNRALDSPAFTLHIFGKKVEWDVIGGYDNKPFGELSKNTEKFIKACDKKWRK